MHALNDIAEELALATRRHDRGGEIIAQAMRDSFDIAYNGQHTGRYRLDQLSKTEKAHIGSLVELSLRRALDGFVEDGDVMDFKILGREVDCKYSMRSGGWMIPTETEGHHAMLCHANDEEATWQLGYLRITPEVLSTGRNKDSKRTLNAQGRESISWAWRDEPMPPNTLLQLPRYTVDLILGHKSGQERVNTLFEHASERIIPRGIVATVAQQKDYMKRIRGNGGSRSMLREKGYIILGDYRAHRRIAHDLGLPTPKNGETISARVVPASSTDVQPTAVIADELWRLAETQDPVVYAPKVSHSG